MDLREAPVGGGNGPEGTGERSGSTGEISACMSLLEHLGDYICVVGSNGNIVWINEKFSRKVGYNPVELTGKPFQVVFFPAAVQSCRIISDILNSGTGVPVMTEKWDLSAKAPVIEGKFIPFPGQSGSVAAVVWAGRDVSDLAMVEEASRASRQKLKDLNGVIRHDILNQLTILIGFLQYSDEYVTDPSIREFVGKEERAGMIVQTLIELTRQYQDLAIRDPCWLSLPELVKAGAEDALPGTIPLAKEIADVEVFATPLIRNVFYTLVKNSIDHGGTISKITISSREESGALVITFEDNGKGIDPVEKAVLFDRGHGRNEGFGLWLAKELLSVTGLAIAETGSPGQGARFEIRVPQGRWRQL